MDEDELIAIILGCSMFICGVGMICLTWRRVEENDRFERFLDVV